MIIETSASSQIASKGGNDVEMETFVLIAVQIILTIGIVILVVKTQRKTERKFENISIKDDAIRGLREEYQKIKEEEERRARDWAKEIAPKMEQGVEEYLKFLDTRMLQLGQMIRNLYSHLKDRLEKGENFEKEASEKLKQANENLRRSEEREAEATEKLIDANNKLQMAKAELKNAKKEQHDIIRKARFEAQEIVSSARERSSMLLDGLARLIPMAREVSEMGEDQKPPINASLNAPSRSGNSSSPFNEKINPHKTRIPTEPNLTPVEKEMALSSLITSGSGVHSLSHLAKCAELVSEGHSLTDLQKNPDLLKESEDPHPIENLSSRDERGSSDTPSCPLEQVEFPTNTGNIQSESPVFENQGTEIVSDELSWEDSEGFEQLEDFLENLGSIK